MFIVLLKMRNHEPVNFLLNFSIDCDKLKKEYPVIEDCACISWEVSSTQDVIDVISGFQNYEDHLSKMLRGYENNNDLSNSEQK